MPAENLAARIVGRAGAGTVVEPGDHDAFLAAADRLLADRAERARAGAAARAYAERTFDIERVTDAFEALLTERAARVCTRAGAAFAALADGR
jgi:glycosyltransferase involved in cell wall biosynthesis